MTFHMGTTPLHHFEAQSAWWIESTVVLCPFCWSPSTLLFLSHPPPPREQKENTLQDFHCSCLLSASVRGCQCECPSVGRCACVRVSHMLLCGCACLGLHKCMRVCVCCVVHMLVWHTAVAVWCLFTLAPHQKHLYCIPSGSKTDSSRLAAAERQKWGEENKRESWKTEDRKDGKVRL